MDWLRGVAVVLMILAHSYDAWLRPDLRTTGAYDAIRLLSGIPSRLFLFLVGVSVAIRLERHIASGASAAATRRQIAVRGLAVVGLAYVFRLQEWILSNFWGPWHEELMRVDILNCIGASMIVVAAVSVPSGKRPRIAASLIAAAFFLALGPFVGPAEFPAWLPRSLSSYIGGQRPMSWFPLFPWGAWALVGVAVGHIWLRAATTIRRTAICFIASGVLGLLCVGTVTAIRTVYPQIIQYPSNLVQQMGPGSFFYRLGLIGILAFVGWAITAVTRGRWSPLLQLGRTSLFVYWIHVDLCYGHLTKALQGKCSLAVSTMLFVGLTLFMLGLSILKTRYLGAAVARVRARLRSSSTRPRDEMASR